MNHYKVIYDNLNRIVKFNELTIKYKNFTKLKIVINFII